jgi:CheY-like chemotaxis protein|tara:strand:- start:431 stop:835 length:405 start_codon:yes stop_codon:yes gene_type:complete
MEQKKTMLVVDPDQTVLRVIELEYGEHYNVMSARSGSEALNIASNGSTSIDLVLAEVDLPGNLNGLDLMHQIRKDRPEVPFILTGSGFPRNIVDEDSTYDERAKAEGVDYLFKPFIGTELEAAVAKHLGNGYKQ